MKRLSNLMGHLSSHPMGGGGSTEIFVANNVSGPSSNRGDDIVVVTGIRTAICKARRGGFKDTPALELLKPCLEYVAKDIDSSLIDDVCVGTVLAPGGLRASECRQAAFLAGYPKTTTMKTVNRQCSSGLQAIADIAGAIQSGSIEIGVAAGLESMSKDAKAMTGAGGYTLTDEIKQCTAALDCLLPMGITSENVAEQFGVTRREQDEAAYQSHLRASKAQERFQEEIIPIATRIRDKKSGKWREIVVKKDDGVRPNTTREGLAKLRAVFKKGGTTTAGNSSQVSDGASAVLVMRRSKANALGFDDSQIMGKLTGFAVAGVDPDVMGIGPAYAIPKVLDQTGLKIADIDLFEINEAFASQFVMCAKKLKLPTEKVNVNGGAIAFGHPLGCTGTRMVVTLLKEMERRGNKRGIVSMCIGSGMGAAAVFERD